MSSHFGLYFLIFITVFTHFHTHIQRSTHEFSKPGTGAWLEWAEERLLFEKKASHTHANPPKTLGMHTSGAWWQGSPEALGANQTALSQWTQGTNHVRMCNVSLCFFLSLCCGHALGFNFFLDSFVCAFSFSDPSPSSVPLPPSSPSINLTRLTFIFINLNHFVTEGSKEALGAITVISCSSSWYFILEQACSSSRTKMSYASSARAAAGLSATLATNSRPQCRSTARGLVQTTIVVKSKNSFPLDYGSVCAAVPRRLSNTLSSRSLCMVTEPISLCIKEIWVQLQLNGE